MCLSMKIPKLSTSLAILDLLPQHTFHLPSIISSSSLLEVDPVPRYMFLIAAATCLACSSLWHLSCGCSDVWVLETGARTDYVGIGWYVSSELSARPQLTEYL